ncbi:MAG: hypothetical protein CMN78_00340 [Spirochaetales bacterium]|nr:hypothetical protein [Spirochaetales bacterium]
MEHQKVLWIIFSVTLFFLVVVVVGFIWLLPPEEGGDDGISRLARRPDSAVDQLDPIEWVRESTEVPGISPAEIETEESGDLLLVYGENEDAKTDEGLADPTPVAQKEDTEDSVKVAVVVEDRPVRTSPTVAVQTQRQEPLVVKVVPKAAPLTPKTVHVTQYWIQAGSFKSRSRAENTQGFLAERGWNTRIISRDVADDTFFRIRVGPYESEGEAEKFLGWIKDLETFESSYISQVYTTQLVN